MATQIQFRRGTKDQHSSFTGATAEITVNTTNKSLHVHDGTTAGGFEVAKADLSNTENVGVLTATTFSGNLTGNVTGNINSSGVSTLGNTVVGGGTTQLIVNGDARITGILTIGSSSITLDGSNNQVNVGAGLTLNHTNGVQVGSNTLHSSGLTLNALNVSGVSTFLGAINASGGITGSITGVAASATQLETPRTFEITGDVVASAISFDGTGNVSLAATIQPNSVALGSDTTGDYVQSVSGTASQITVTGGTGEGSTPVLSLPTGLVVPQDLTVTRDLIVTRDLQVTRNLNVDGNITIGGTNAYITATELNVFDADIVVGYRTDAFGNDISTDNTANHGGIAVASTEGTPLITLFDVGIGETNPATYKKIMWFKENSFSGLGTDTWISNYPISIGTTSALSGSRLTVGAGFTVYDNLLDVQSVTASNVSAAQSITAAFFYGDGSGITNAGSTLSAASGTQRIVVTGQTSGSMTATATDADLTFDAVTNTLNVVGLNVTGVGTVTKPSEKINFVGNTGAAATINLDNGSFVTATLTDNCTFTFSNPSNGAVSFTLVLTNDATPSRTITWPASVKWPNATVPVRTEAANKTDVYTFFTYDSGSIWWGNLSLYNFS